MLPKLREHFEKIGYQTLTPIQEAVWQPLTQGESVVGLAPTGSGKTIAFTLPLLSKITSGEGTQLLILSPSQELAMQTTEVVREWAKLLRLTVTAITGGANVKRQIEKLKTNPEIIIGTPGRVLNLVNERKLKLHLIQSLVIDEADELLTDETLKDIKDIEFQTSNDVQLALFSATTTTTLENLDELFGQSIKTIDVRAIDTTQGHVLHGNMQLANKQKVKMLQNFSHIKDFKALVFVNQTDTLNFLNSSLRHAHVPAAALGGKQRGLDRAKALRMFRKGEIQFLLTTDVAARGLDIPDLPAVINFELPSEKLVYTHRVGRTGRMGKDGLVINFGNEHDFRNLKKHLGTAYQLEKVFFANNKIVNTPVKTTATTITNKNTQRGAHTDHAAHTDLEQKAKISENNSKKQVATVDAKTAQPLTRKQKIANQKKARKRKGNIKNKGMRRSKDKA